jgi:hypothetical protein
VGHLDSSVPGVMIGLAFIGKSLGLSSIFRKQWMENEKLTYPMMIPPQILAGDRKELMAASSRRFPLFWAGFPISFGILAWNALTFFNEYLPNIDLRGGWVPLVSGGIKRLHVTDQLAHPGPRLFCQCGNLGERECILRDQAHRNHHRNQNLIYHAVRQRNDPPGFCEPSHHLADSRRLPGACRLVEMERKGTA